MSIKRVGAAALTAMALLACHGVLASATAEDYADCHRLTAATLQYCLDRHGNGDDRACWQDAKRAKDMCYREIKERYASYDARCRGPGAARCRAEKDARIAAERAARARQEQAEQAGKNGVAP